MKEEYESSISKNNLSISFIQACAEVVNSKEIKEVLELYNLSSDFECTVFHPDDPNYKNLCK